MRIERISVRTAGALTPHLRRTIGKYLTAGARRDRTYLRVATLPDAAPEPTRMDVPGGHEAGGNFSTDYYGGQIND